jgi:orotidine-5'-phosphate decarboxylase
MKKAELIVALDVPDSSSIGDIVDRLPDEVRWYKVGLELFAAEGPAALAPLARRGRHIFLDLKLHDIPRTVERAVRAAARHGVGLVTLHAAGGRAMIEAAAEAARGAGPTAPKLLAVTVLTSLDAADLAAIGVGRSPAEQVVALASLALSAGADGIVCSPQEAAAMRARFGAGPLLVTPGIRLPSDAVGDQKRVATPAGAVRDGATHLVVGRPILEAEDPAAAARRVLADMAAGEAG